MAIVGAAIGILVALSLVILIVIVLLFILRRGKAKQRSYNIPGERYYQTGHVNYYESVMPFMVPIIVVITACCSLPDELMDTSTFTRSDSHIYHSQEDPKKERGSVAPNPLYHSPEHKNGVTDSTDPYYTVISADTSRDHSSTIRTVPNPVYGALSPTQKSEGIYSLPKPLTSSSNKESSSPYDYARVETSRMSLKSSSGSVIRKDQGGLSPYEYISMAPAEAAIPEKEPTAVSLSPNSDATGQTKVVFKRSIYDDDFQYEVVTLANGGTRGKGPDSVDESHQSDTAPTSSHYDVPKANARSQKEQDHVAQDSTPTYGNVPQLPSYDRLNHGTDFTRPTNSTRLAKIEGSGYEILNSNN